MRGKDHENHSSGRFDVWTEYLSVRRGKEKDGVKKRGATRENR